MAWAGPSMLGRRAPPMMPPLTPEWIAYNNAPHILGVVGSFFTVAAIVVLLRCYTRFFILKTFGRDDWAIVVAMALNTATFVCVVLRTTYGLGKHTLVIYMNLDNALKLGRVLYFQSLLMMLGNSAVKISIALTLLRLSSQRTSKYSYFLWGSIVFLVLMTLGCGGSLVFQCTGPVSAAWDYAERSPPFGKGTAKCYNNDVFRDLGLMNSIFNIVTDVAFACLPIPLVWKLQLSLRTKLSLVAILSLGWFACSASIVKTVYQWRVFDEVDWTVHDSFNVWGFVEMAVGIISASLPSLKPLFKGVLENAKAMSSGRRSRAGPYRIDGSKSSAGYSKTTDAEIGLDYVNNASTQHVNAPTRPTGLADKEAWEAAHRNDSDEDMFPLEPLPRHTWGSSGTSKPIEINVQN